MEIKRIEIGGKELPIKCNINCLIDIQEQFGDFKSFEEGLIGIKRTIEDGKAKVIYTTPKMKNISYALPLFIKTGLKDQEEECDFDYKKSIEDVDFDILEVAICLFDEFQRCFYRKKSTALKSTKSIRTKKQKTDKSTSQG